MAKINMQDIIIANAVRQFSKKIDHEIINKIWENVLNPAPYVHVKTFKKHKTNETRHIIHVNDEVWEWLTTEQNCFGQKNPSWTISGAQINISDELYSILVLKFAK